MQGCGNNERCRTAARQKVLINSEDLPQLEEGEYYVADLIGLPVFDTAGTQFGTLKDVLSTGSNDVYVIAVPEGKDILVGPQKAR